MPTRRKVLKSLAISTLAAPVFLRMSQKSSMDFDILIFGGTVCDGTGKPQFKADIGIKGIHIQRIGRLSEKSGRYSIDARGKIIAPGFIDMHSHSDIPILVDGRAMSKTLQGVTTEVIGQDGSSIAPLNDKRFEELNAATEKNYGVQVTWQDFTDYFARLRQQGISVNIMSMVGAGTLRELVVGLKNRRATDQEIKQMQMLLEQCLKQGARHLSAGLEYAPGSFADSGELAALASVLKARGVYATHIRNEDDHLEAAIEEALTIGRNAGCGVHISHLKAQGMRNWHKLDRIFFMLEAARHAGMQVTGDRYPYVAYSTGLSNLFPIWALDGGNRAFIARLQTLKEREKMKMYVLDKISALGSWDAVQISSVRGDRFQAAVGRRLGEFASELGRDPYSLLVDILVDQNGGGGMVGYGMSEDNTRRILSDPFIAIASDGSARTVDGPLGRGNPHPRNYGTFPRLLGYYVREEKIMPIEEAIRKITALPAQILGLQNRGRLQAGMAADIVVFDPDRLVDRATFTEPRQYAQGIEFVIVNGKVVVEHEVHTGAKPGQIL